MQSDGLDNALWRFATHFYAKPGIAESLLMLQDVYRLDINLMLLMLYLDQQNQTINNMQLRHIMSHSKIWQEKASMMRALRRDLKSLNDDLYQKAKAFELNIEQHYIGALFNLIKETSMTMPNKVANCNVNLYLRHSLDHVQVNRIIEQCDHVFAIAEEL